MKQIIRNILGVTMIIIMSLVVVNLVENEDEDAVKGNLTIWACSDSYDYLLTAAKKFEELNAKADINVIRIEDDNYKGRIEEIIGSSNGAGNELPDMVELGSVELRELYKKYEDKLNGVDNIIDVCLKNYTSNRLSEVEMNGKNFAVPIISRPLVLYLRQDILNQYGYSNENINTWDEFISMGKDIYEKSGGTIKILNSVGSDYDDLVSVLVMQAMEESTDEDKIKENVNNSLARLENENILNKELNGKFLARIASNNAMRELSKLDEKCEWTANDILSKYNGSNRFYVAEGKNLLVLKENERTAKLMRKFIDYLSNNTAEISNNINNGDFFLSFISTYKNKDIENPINNFKGRNPIVVMDNITKKSPSCSNYDMYAKIKSEYNN